LECNRSRQLDRIRRTHASHLNLKDTIDTTPHTNPQTKRQQQFQDRAFWDNFFRERGTEAFEWYGTFRELRPYVAKAIPERTGAASHLLVVGCGNSDFSTQLYLEGGYHNVVNVDFSAPVIAEMRAKTAALCPDMQWRVQDVTALEIEAQAVDAVLDKGTLDAIFSTPESEPQVRTCIYSMSRQSLCNGSLNSSHQKNRPTRCWRRWAASSRGTTGGTW
jgi:hypothetical protein